MRKSSIQTFAKLISQTISAQVYGIHTIENNQLEM